MSSSTPPIPSAQPGQRQFPCRQCGAALQFEPGQTCLKCPYCQAENEIEAGNATVAELDFDSALKDLAEEAGTHEILTVKCAGCGAESEFSRNVTADRCPFCGAPIVAGGNSQK